MALEWPPGCVCWPGLSCVRVRVRVCVICGVLGRVPERVSLLFSTVCGCVCGGTDARGLHEVEVKVDAGSTLEPWTCECTLINSPLANWCDACGGPAPLAVTRALDGPRDDALDEYAAYQRVGCACLYRPLSCVARP
jgi:hypothetical protein